MPPAMSDVERTFTIKDFVEWGRKGGEARRDSLTPEERSAIARKGAKARRKSRAASLKAKA